MNSAASFLELSMIVSLPGAAPRESTPARSYAFGRGGALDVGPTPRVSTNFRRAEYGQIRPRRAPATLLSLDTAQDRSHLPPRNAYSRKVRCRRPSSAHRQTSHVRKGAFPSRRAL